MRKIFFVFSFALCVIVVNSVTAHNLSQGILDAWTEYENWDGRLNAGVIQLNN